MYKPSDTADKMTATEQLQACNTSTQTRKHMRCCQYATCSGPNPAPQTLHCRNRRPKSAHPRLPLQPIPVALPSLPQPTPREGITNTTSTQPEVTTTQQNCCAAASGNNQQEQTYHSIPDCVIIYALTHQHERCKQILLVSPPDSTTALAGCTQSGAWLTHTFAKGSFAKLASRQETAAAAG